MCMFLTGGGKRPLQTVPGIPGGTRAGAGKIGRMIAEEVMEIQRYVQHPAHIGCTAISFTKIFDSIMMFRPQDSRLLPFQLWLQSFKYHCHAPTWHLLSRGKEGERAASQNHSLTTFTSTLKGIVHPKKKICWKSTRPQAIKDVDESVSSSEHIWRNLALRHLFTNGSTAVNGCRQNESPNSR